MNLESLRELLTSVQSGEITVEEAERRLGGMPFEDLGHTKIDFHRPLRTGSPEAIYCERKTPEQVIEIAERMTGRGQSALMTRLSPGQREALRRAHPEAPIEFCDLARAALWRVGAPPAQKRGRVAALCAGTSDLPVLEEAVFTARAFGSPVDVFSDCGVAGIHRLLAHREALGAARVILVVAGMEGALASVVGGLARAPVIAVPTSVGYGASFGGLAALLTMLNSCAPGVAVVNIDNGFGAGLLADKINALGEIPGAAGESSP